VAEICVPYDSDAMAAIQVSAIVNNARNDVPECVLPAPELDDLFS